MASAGDKKPLHSSKLMQMKFMQRGVQRKQMQEQSEKQVGPMAHSSTTLEAASTGFPAHLLTCFPAHSNGTGPHFLAIRSL